MQVLYVKDEFLPVGIFAKAGLACVQMKMAVSHQPRLLLEDVSKGSVALLMSLIPHVLKAAAVPANAFQDNLTCLPM